MSIFFMHDDGRSVRWRMGISLIRTLAVFMVMIIFVAAGSVYLNVRLLSEREDLRDQVSVLEQERDQHRQNSVRLANLEQFLLRNDPENLNKLIVAMTPELPVAIQQGGELTPEAEADLEAAQAAQAAMPQGPELPGTTDVLSPSVQAAEAVELSEPDTADAEVVSPPITADTEPTEISVPAEGTDTEVAQTADPEADTQDGASQPFVAGQAYPEILTEEPVDTGYARVENLSARKVGARSLRISFDLLNNDRVPQLAGNSGFELVLPDGKLYPLSSQGGTRYRISRFKTIVGNPTLPEGVSDVAGARIRVSVYAEEGLIYRSLVPLQ